MREPHVLSGVAFWSLEHPQRKISIIFGEDFHHQINPRLGEERLLLVKDGHCRVTLRARTGTSTLHPLQ